MKVKKPSLFTSNSVLIKYNAEVDPELNGYEVDMLTPYGVYFTRIEKKGFLYMSTITQTSFDTCADLDESEFPLNTDVAGLNTFVLANYWQLAGYSLELVQGKISSLGNVSYRMLYASGDHRYQVLADNQLGSFSISSIVYFSGSSCSPTEVLLNGSCSKKCTDFVFWWVYMFSCHFHTS